MAPKTDFCPRPPPPEKVLKKAFATMSDAEKIEFCGRLFDAHDKPDCCQKSAETGKLEQKPSSLASVPVAAKEERADLSFAALPMFITPRAKIDVDGRVLNLDEFKAIDDIFDFSKCLDCLALTIEHYGSRVESPCVKCDCLVKRIKEMNHTRTEA